MLWPLAQVPILRLLWTKMVMFSVGVLVNRASLVVVFLTAIVSSHWFLLAFHCLARRLRRFSLEQIMPGLLTSTGSHGPGDQTTLDKLVYQILLARTTPLLLVQQRSLLYQR